MIVNYDFVVVGVGDSIADSYSDKKTVESIILKETNQFLFFNDYTQKDKFNKLFHASKLSIFGVIYLTVCTLLSGIIVFSTLAYGRGSTNFVYATASIGILSLVSGLSIFLFQNDVAAKWLSLGHGKQRVIASTWMISCCFMAGSLFILQVLNGHCDDDKHMFRHSYSCNGELNKSPLTLAMVTLFFPLGFTSFINFIPWKVALITNVGQVAFVLSGLALSGDIQDRRVVVRMVFFGISIAAMLFEARWRKLRMFVVTERERYYRQREKEADAIQSNEMRHLIGNLTHDLKSVSRLSLNK